jgi:sulfide:quinone oxidoreductase
MASERTHRMTRVFARARAISTRRRAQAANGRVARRSGERLRVVVTGGGVAGLEAVLTLAECAGEALDVTLVSDRDDFVLRAQPVGELFRMGRADRLSLGDIAQHAGVTFRRARATGVDASERRLLLADHHLPYDALLLATGASSRPVYHAATTWSDTDPDVLAGLVRDVEEGYSRSVAFVVPPGPVWPLPAYELALLLRRDADGMGEDVEITLVTSEPRPLAAFGPTMSAAAGHALERAGIHVEAGVAAELRHNHRVGDYGAVAGLERVWAAGDGIAYPIKHGGLAAQQAAAAAAAIASIAVDGPTAPWWPPDGAVGERLATYLTSHGAGASLLSRRAWLADGART